MNKNSIKLTLAKLNTSRGVKISDIISELKETHNKSNSIKCAKLLLTIGWTKGQKDYRDGDKRFYLWFPPSTSTVQIEASELDKLREENYSLKLANSRLQETVEEAKQEINALHRSLDAHLDSLRPR